MITLITLIVVANAELIDNKAPQHKEEVKTEEVPNQTPIKEELEVDGLKRLEELLVHFLNSVDLFEGKELSKEEEKKLHDGVFSMKGGWLSVLGDVEKKKKVDEMIGIVSKRIRTFDEKSQAKDFIGKALSHFQHGFQEKHTIKHALKRVMKELRVGDKNIEKFPIEIGEKEWDIIKNVQIEFSPVFEALNSLEEKLMEYLRRKDFKDYVYDVKMIDMDRGFNLFGNLGSLLMGILRNFTDSVKSEIDRERFDDKKEQEVVEKMVDSAKNVIKTASSKLKEGIVFIKDVVVFQVKLFEAILESIDKAQLNEEKHQ
uniref:Uncharacterized protein n=1 Tax=Entamoeba invadens TaxID=33085 RepID=S0B2R5_ENTIV|nr:hypothetical protein [Entamoeba invadens]